MILEQDHYKSRFGGSQAMKKGGSAKKKKKQGYKDRKDESIAMRIQKEKNSCTVKS